MATKRADDLVPAGCLGADILADGAIVLHLSFQLNWIYAKVVKGGRFTTRRYRYGQQVRVQ